MTDFNKHTRVTFCFSHRCTHFFVFVNIVLFIPSPKPRWRRETRIKSVAGRPQGEVAYYAPCGKKLRQYPDVMKVPGPHGLTARFESVIQILLGKKMSRFVCNSDYCGMVYDLSRKDFFPPLITAKPLIHIAQRNAYVSGFVLYYLCYCSSCPSKPPPHASTLPAFCDHNSDR